MVKRNYGIDLLRLVCIFMVVLLHVFTIGRADAAKWDSTNGIVAAVFKSALYCTVNCYAIISGYVMFPDRASRKKLVPLWLQAFVYSAGITLIFSVAYPNEIAKIELLRSCFPILTKQWWYLSSYFVLLVFAPLLNLLVEKAERKTLTISLIFSVAIICLATILFNIDAAGMNFGYSAMWLMLLYLLGAYIRKYRCFTKRRVSFYALMFCVFAALTTVLHLLGRSVIGRPISRLLISNAYLQYTTPMVLGCAVCLFVIFMRMSVGEKMQKIVKFFSPAALGVYLIHIHPVVNRQLLKGFASSYSMESPPIFLGKTFVAALIIFVGSLIIELVRIYVFKCLRVQKLCDWLCIRIKNTCNKLYCRLIGE